MEIAKILDETQTRDRYNKGVCMISSLKAGAKIVVPFITKEVLAKRATKIVAKEATKKMMKETVAAAAVSAVPRVCSGASTVVKNHSLKIEKRQELIKELNLLPDDVLRNKYKTTGIKEEKIAIKEMFKVKGLDL